MPRFVSVLPGGTTYIVLGAASVARITIAAVQSGDDVHLALVYRYPPNPFAVPSPNGQLVPLMEAAQAVLLRTEAIPFARNKAELDPVARVALLWTTVDENIARMREGFNLFRNGSRPPRQEDMERILQQGDDLLRCYHEVAEWLAAEQPERKRYELGGGLLTCAP